LDSPTDIPRFEAPLIFHERYLDFIQENRARFHSVHFSLHTDGLPDARYRFETHSPDVVQKGLEKLSGIRKYALLNSCFHHPDAYFKPATWKTMAKVLTPLVDAGLVDGIVFSDLYFLNAFSDALPHLAEQLEAIPSINFMLDTWNKCRIVLDAVTRTRFRPPTKINLDRSLNRRMSRLADVVSQIRERHPGIQICLLVNEGCIYQCPFKKAHDAHISLSNTGLAPERNHDMARTFGCRRTYENTPIELLKSPFIRPEDVAAYHSVADVFKICGRTLGTGFLEQTISAYLAGAYKGNLLDLMDTASYLASSIYLDNAGIPDEFAGRVTTCDFGCDDCGYCDKVFDKCARPRDLRVPQGL
jgi:collagenase-like PrtC family protease